MILNIPRMDDTNTLTMIWEVPMMGGDINLMIIYGKYPWAYMDLSMILEIPRMGGKVLDDGEKGQMVP